MSMTKHFHQGARVFVAGLTSESSMLREELVLNPERAAGVEFTSVQLSGVDQTDYLRIHPESKTCSFFMTPGVRKGLLDRRTALYPLDYMGIARHLEESVPYDISIGQFTSPDSQGWCHPGLSVDFLPIVWKRAKRRVAHLNPALPRIESSFRLHVSELDNAVEATYPPLSIQFPSPDEVTDRIGRHASSLIRDGDTLQFGIGAIAHAVARSLVGHRRLRVLSGMVAPWLRTLWENGAIDRDARIMTGVLFGDANFYEFAESLDRVFLDDVRATHDMRAISKVPQFVAINSAVEIDLLGQVNSERTDGTLHAGAGGLPAYAQASLLSREGRLLICLPSTARSGTISRIVTSLDSTSMCTLPRHLSDFVVTEYGVAELRGMSIARRAEALIAIAAPQHREHLYSTWDQMRVRL